MSERPPAQGIPVSSAHDGNEAPRYSQSTPSLSNQNVQPSTRLPTTGSSLSMWPATQAPDRSLELPPLPQASSIPGGGFSPSASRAAVMPSILNPSQTDENAQQSLRRKAAQLDSPSMPAPSLPRLGTGSQNTPSVSSLISNSPVGQYSATADRPPRRILTPRSPAALHRAASLSLLNPSAGTINAQLSPFPRFSLYPRIYTGESGTSQAPPLPTPPAGLRQNYGFPPVAPTPPIHVHRGSSVGINPTNRAPSSSASPSTSYSSYAGQTSPSGQFAPVSLSTLSTSYITANEPSAFGPGTASAPSNLGGTERQRQFGIPISSSGGQNVYQMMTLETTAGQVHLPVDIQAASRVADEKRRRNAGASARFRQRRKEKEREASGTIAKLEQQLKEKEEDADFYKREREYLAGVVLQVPGGERHFPRPQSPRHRRPSPPIAGPSRSSSSSYMQNESSGRSPEQGRSVRRRTSTFSLSGPVPQTGPSSGPLLQSSYGAPSYQAAQPMQQMQQMQHMPQHQPVPHNQLLPSPGGRVPLPSPSTMTGGFQTPQQQPLPQLMQAAPQTGPPNPYQYDRPRPPGPPAHAR